MFFYNMLIFNKEKNHKRVLKNLNLILITHLM